MELITGLCKYLLAGITYKKGSLFMASLALSVPTSLGFRRFKNLLMQKFNTDDFVLNIVVALALFCIIMLVVSFDTVTGIMRAKKLGEKITPSKGLISVFKVILYTMFIFIVMVFQAIAVIYGWGALDSVLVVTLFTMALLITLWEFKSIGDNISIVFDKRIEMFNFIDKITDLIESMVIDRIRNSDFCKPKK
jgi:hypothetical protein